MTTAPARPKVVCRVASSCLPFHAVDMERALQAPDRPPPGVEEASSEVTVLDQLPHHPGTRIWPGSASEHSLAATETATPKTSSERSTGFPGLIPIRTASALAVSSLRASTLSPDAYTNRKRVQRGEVGDAKAPPGIGGNGTGRHDPPRRGR